jgi:hypothetical protein
LKIEPAAQVRQKCSASVVKRYALAMRQQKSEGVWRFPPVVVFDDGASLWLADGRQRCQAAEQAGLGEILAEIRSGSERDALLFAISANTDHGLPRTTADKRKAVTLLLADGEWSQWSDREIARRCQVSNHFVTKLRSGASGNVPRCARKVQRGDAVYEMNTDAKNTQPELASAQDETPKEKAPSLPICDPSGLPLHERTAPAFTYLSEFEAAHKTHADLAALVDQLAKCPGGEPFRQSLVLRHRDGKSSYFSPELEAFGQKLRADTPHCGYCPQCHAQPGGAAYLGCKRCGGRGWVTRAAFDTCSHDEQMKLNHLRDGKPQAAFPST